MDLPPLDHPGWDRLLTAVMDGPTGSSQRSTVGDSDTPLATPFPGGLRSAAPMIPTMGIGETAERDWASITRG